MGKHLHPLVHVCCFVRLGLGFLLLEHFFVLILFLDQQFYRLFHTAGFDDRSVLDATLVIGYFNFVNRIVLSLGVTLEEDKGEGYKY